MRHKLRSREFRRGAALVEYAILLMLFVIAAVPAINNLQGSERDAIRSTSARIGGSPVPPDPVPTSRVTTTTTTVITTTTTTTTTRPTTTTTTRPLPTTTTTTTRPASTTTRPTSTTTTRPTTTTTTTRPTTTTIET